MSRVRLQREDRDKGSKTYVLYTLKSTIYLLIEQFHRLYLCPILFFDKIRI